MSHMVMTITFTTLVLFHSIGYVYTILIFLLYYKYFCKYPRLIYKLTEYNKRISKMKIMNKIFYPYILALHGILQSFVDRFRKMKRRTGSILFEKDDGIFFVEDYQNNNMLVIRHVDTKNLADYIKKNKNVNDKRNTHYIYNRILKQKENYKKKDTVFLIHGFNSSSDSNYIVSLANHLTPYYNVFAFNSRGTKMNLLTFHYFHVGYTDDVNHVLEYLLAITDGRISIIGFSLGANWTAILMSKINNERISCGVGISMPFDFIKLNISMQGYFNCILNRYLTGKMRRFLYKHIKTFTTHKRRIIGENHSQTKIERTIEKASKGDEAENYLSIDTEKVNSPRREENSKKSKLNYKNDKTNFKPNKISFKKDKVNIKKDKFNIKNEKVDYKKNQISFKKDIVKNESEKVDFSKNQINFDRDKLKAIKDNKNIASYDIESKNKSKITSLTLEEIDKCSFIHQVDRNITTKIFNFDSLDDFYIKGSSINYLEYIKKPFLVINACDDPVVPLKTIDIERVKATEHVFLALPENGGHLGFMGYNWEKTYVEEAIIEFLQLVHE